MGKHVSESIKKLICKEYLSSGSTQKDFCVSKQITLSSLQRWLSNYGDKSPEAKSPPLQQLKIKANTNVNSKVLNPIQVVLTSGIKINLPPNYCNHSLKSIISILGGANA